METACSSTCGIYSRSTKPGVNHRLQQSRCQDSTYINTDISGNYVVMIQLQVYHAQCTKQCQQQKENKQLSGMFEYFFLWSFTGKCLGLNWQAHLYNLYNLLLTCTTNIHASQILHQEDPDHNHCAASPFHCLLNYNLTDLHHLDYEKQYRS